MSSNNIRNLTPPNHNAAQLSSSSQSSTSSTTRPRDALITIPPTPLELRQNNPQDCSNLITASVNAATVEISRTIIALNATFSQQLQQASISASNGIKSAQGSASSTIAVVVQSASIATSSAFSSITVANLAVTSANLALSSAQSTITSVNLALSNVSAASSSDVSRLSSSLALLQASVTSLQASASSASASAASVTQSLPSNQPQSASKAPPTISLTAGQAAAITVGTVIFSILLSVAVYFLVTRMKRRQRDSYLNDNDSASSPRKLPARSSSTFRTGNAMVIKFNPRKSSSAAAPSSSALRQSEDYFVTSSPATKREPSQTVVQEVDDSTSVSSTWPLALSFTEELDVPFHEPLSPGPTSQSLKFNAIDQIHVIPTSQPNTETTEGPLGPSSPNLANEVQTTVNASSSSREPTFKKVAAERPFLDFCDAPVPAMVEEVPGKQIDRTSIGEGKWFMTAEEPDHDEATTQQLGEPVLGLVEEPNKELYEQPIDEEIVRPPENPTRPIEQRLDELAPENLFAQPSTRVSVLETFNFFREDEQARYSTEAEIEMDLDMIIQDEVIDNRALDLSDFGAVDQKVERPIISSPPREPSQVKETPLLNEIPLPRQETEDAEMIERREKTPSPLRQHQVPDLTTVETEPVLPSSHPPIATEQRDSSSPRPPSMELREISPLRRNPPIRNINSLLAEHEVDLDSEKPTDVTDQADIGYVEARGRNMIRTSDIIEARLSGAVALIKGLNEVPVEELGREEKERTDSPLRRNPVDPTPQMERISSPLRRNNTSAGSSPNSLLRPITGTLSRGDSPLRFNHQQQNTRSSPTSDNNSSTPTINAQFTQMLSRFQTLAAQNPTEAFEVSNEVTQRAIAGIYIPGSLREQAVRNLSKSRERGQSRSRRS